MSADSTGLVILTERECWDLLAGARVGRVVVSMDAMPAAFPVNYQAIGREIYFLTAAGTKLSAAVNHTVVAFEVDDFDPSGTFGWSVLAVGTARLVTDAKERDLLDRAGIHSWVARDDGHYVAIGVNRVTGRRLLPAPRREAILEAAAPPLGSVG